MILTPFSRLQRAIQFRHFGIFSFSSSSSSSTFFATLNLNPTTIASLPLSSRLAIAKLGKIPPSERTSVPVPARVFVAIARTLQLEDLSSISTHDLVDLVLSLRAGIASGGSISLQDSAATVALAAVEVEIARRNDLFDLDDDTLADIFASTLSHSKNLLLVLFAKEAARRSGSARISARRALGCDIQSTINDSSNAVLETDTSLPDDAAKALKGSLRQQRTVLIRPLGQTAIEQQPWRYTISSDKPQLWHDLASKGFTSALVAALVILSSSMAVSILAHLLSKRLPSQRRMTSEEYKQFQERARERASLKVQ